MSDTSPFFIEQTAVLIPNQSASMSLLDNLVREKWKLREIRIIATPLDANGNPVYPNNPNGTAPVVTPPATWTSDPVLIAEELGVASMIDFGLRLQSTYLTVPRTVPAELLRSPFYDSLSEPEDEQTILDAQDPATSFPLIPQRGMIWTFPKPLYVPPGAKMYAELLFNAAEGANSFMYNYMQVQVTLIGNRTTEDAPEKSCIPYATTYRTPKTALGAAGNVQEFRAQDFQLQNHCDETVFVQRLTAYNVGAGRIPTKIRYSTSQGKMINRELAPLLELHSNGALNLHTVLEKNEFIAVEGEIDSTPARTATPYQHRTFAAGVPGLATTPLLTATHEQQAMFGLVGYREVDTKALWGPALISPETGQAVNLRQPPMLPYSVDLRQPKLRPFSPALPWPKK